MAHLALSVLGELQVSIDDVPISAFESDKVRALLAYLAVEASHSHRRETLIGLLWPDYPELDARHNLRQALFKLRLALNDYFAKPPYLLINRDSIQFNRESSYVLDIDQINTAFTEWEKDRGLKSPGDPTLVPRLEEIVKLYRGEFLQHFSLKDSAEFEEWILVQRETLHQRIMQVLAFLADEAEEKADFQTAQRYALRQLELDPWREEAHCQLMRVLALDGQRSAALAQYDICRKVLAEELGVDPSSRTRDLFEQIRSDAIKIINKEPIHVPSAPIHNLPISLTPFVGRGQELTDLDRLITDPMCRCITLVGPGGIGKTRLAVQLAENHVSEYGHGTAFISLASVSSLEAIISTIANGINYSFYGPGDPKGQLLKYLREKQILLVLDNLEHLLAEGLLQGSVIDLLIEILQQAPQVKLLVTSREAMNLQGEWLFEVQGLPYPIEEQADGFDEYGAVALFVQRARQACPGFEMNMADKTSLVYLCRLVEGMPLAIELAASWVRALSISEIAAEIENSLDFLNASMRDLPERHRSIRAVFDRSWETLPAEEKQVISQLSVFRGSFSRKAAEQVARASLSVLSSLVTRSLLRRTPNGRYDLHELIRQYAASKLAEGPGELHGAQERHSKYYLSFLEERAAQLQSHQQKEALAELTDEIDNFRAAWDWSVANHNFLPLYRVSDPLWYLFELRSWFKEGEVTFQKTAEALRLSIQTTQPEDDLQLLVLHALLGYYGYFVFRQGRGAEAYIILSPSVTFLQSSPDPSAAIPSQCFLSIVCWEQGKYAEGKENLTKCIEIAQKYGKRWYEAAVNEYLGIVAHDQGEYHKARQYLTNGLAIYRQLGDRSMMAHLLSYLGRTMTALEEYSDAEKLLNESLGYSRESGYLFGTSLALDALGQVVSAQGRLAEAQDFFSESAGLFREMGDTHRLSRTLNHEGLNWLALNQVDEAQNAFRTALSLAYEGGLTPSALNALAGLAALDSHQKASQKRLELVLYILKHPASPQEAKTKASQLLAKLETELPRQEIDEAKVRVKSMDLDEVVLTVNSNKTW